MTDTRRTITAWRLALWVWRQHQARHVLRERPVFRPASSADGCAALERIALLGCRVDRSPSPMDWDWAGNGAPVPDDVWTVNEWAASIRSDTVAWTVRCAESGEPPEWDLGTPRYSPRLNRSNGRHEVTTATMRWRGRSGGTVTVQSCPVHLVPSVGEVAAARELYTSLVDGLEMVETVFAESLETWLVRGVGLPREPWSTIRASVSAARVFSLDQR